MQDVVGLGGSVGSIEALKTFFSYMPEDSGLPFVVVLHLSPKYESSLEVVLQKWTSMPVFRVSEPIKVEANCVYVIPPRKHLLMDDGHLILTALPMSTAVDIFFRTLPKRTGPVRPHRCSWTHQSRMDILPSLIRTAASPRPPRGKISIAGGGRRVLPTSRKLWRSCAFTTSGKRRHMRFFTKMYRASSVSEA